MPIFFFFFFFYGWADGIDAATRARGLERDGRTVWGSASTVWCERSISERRPANLTDAGRDNEAAREKFARGINHCLDHAPERREFVWLDLKRSPGMVTLCCWAG